MSNRLTLGVLFCLCFAAAAFPQTTPAYHISKTIPLGTPDRWDMDTRSNTADAHWLMPGCVKPHGLAIDRAHALLFASCANKVMTVVDAKTGAIRAMLPIGEGTDFAEFDDKRELALSSNRDGTLSVIAEKSPERFEAMPAVPTAFGARTMALDSKTGRIFLVTADMTVNEGVAASDPRHRYSVKAGSVKLLFLDPAS